jgi:selenide,water dikinase
VRLRRALQNQEAARDHPIYPLLFDPQTAGGLLAGVPEARAPACLVALHGLGYTQATPIGRVLPQGETTEPIRLVV